MAATTVVDQFIVKLGLDPRDFTKGEKEVASEVFKAKEVVRKGSDDMSKSFGKAAQSFGASGGSIAKVFSRGGVIGLAIAAAIAAGKILNDKLYEISENTRKLGLDARNFNTSAAGLRNMQNAAELAGGSIDDATNSASSLGKSLFDLKYNGAISDQLIQLGRLGVRFEDAGGKARDFKDVALDTADALAKLQANGSMSRADAYQFASQAGFGGGMANLVADGRGALESALAKQGARRQVNGEDVRTQTSRVNDFLSLGQAVEARGVQAATAESPAAGAVSRGLESMVNGGPGVIGAVGETLTGAVDKASVALGDLTDNAKLVGHSFGNAAGQQGAWFRSKVYGPSLDAAADKYGIDRGVMRGIARVESGYDPSAVNPTSGAKGIMQLNPKFFPNAGKNPYSDIDTAAQHFSGLLQGTEGSEQERYTAALRMYNAGEGNYRKGTKLGPENRAYAGKVLAGTDMAMPTPNAQGGGGGKGDVTFENVTIVTPRTDGQGVATAFVDTATRKLNAAQAETGMN